MTFTMLYNFNIKAKKKGFKNLEYILYLFFVFFTYKNTYVIVNIRNLYKEGSPSLGLVYVKTCPDGQLSYTRS